jgi:hypothetical protein
MKQEALVWRQLKHDRILDFIGVERHEPHGLVSLLMELETLALHVETCVDKGSRISYQERNIFVSPAIS